MAIGAGAAIVNLFIISVSIERAVERGKKGPVTLGFFLRILLYGGAFVLAVRLSGVTAVGAVIGFLIPRVSLYIKHGLLPTLREKLGKEPKPVYKTDTSSNLFIKEPSQVKDFGGRTYLTYHHYRKIRVIPELTGPAGPENEKKEKKRQKDAKRTY